MQHRLIVRVQVEHDVGVVRQRRQRVAQGGDLAPRLHRRQRRGHRRPHRPDVRRGIPAQPSLQLRHEHRGEIGIVAVEIARRVRLVAAAQIALHLLRQPDRVGDRHQHHLAGDLPARRRLPSRPASVRSTSIPGNSSACSPGLQVGLRPGAGHAEAQTPRSPAAFPWRSPAAILSRDCGLAAASVMARLPVGDRHYGEAGADFAIAPFPSRPPTLRVDTGARQPGTGTTMEIVSTAVYVGPNVYAKQPLIRLTVDLHRRAEKPVSSYGDGMIETLFEHLPGLATATSELGTPFVDRLAAPDCYLGELMAQVAIALQNRAAPAEVAMTRPAAHEDEVEVLYGYESEEIGLEAGEVARGIILELIAPREDEPPFDIAEAIDDFDHFASRRSLGPSALALVRAAEARDIPWMRMNDASLIQVGQGKYQKRIEAALTSQTSHTAVEIAADKELCIACSPTSASPCRSSSTSATPRTPSTPPPPSATRWW